MKKRIYPFLLCMACLWAGCIEEYNADLPFSDQDLLVVEGNITANSDVIFNLSKTFSLSENAPSEDYNKIEATIHVVGSNGYRSEPGEQLEQGHYRVRVGELDDHSTYQVEIVYNGNTYQSSPAKPIYTPPIDSVSFKQVGYEDIHLSVSTHDPAADKQYYLWTFDEDWEIVSYYYVTDFYDPEKNQYYEMEKAPYYYCWGKDVSHTILIGSTEALSENRIVNRQIHTINPYSERVKTLYCITLQQRAIRKEAYDFYVNKLKQNEEMGGLFTPQPSELPSNITCITDRSKKAIGYVDVSKNVSVYRKYVSSRELSIPGFPRCLPIDWDALGLTTAAEKHAAGYRLVMRDPEGTTDWRDAECGDCRVRGGTKTKPYFWPNNHE